MSTSHHAAAADVSLIHWSEEDTPCSARWHSENGMPPPKRVVTADDRMTADDAYRLACGGTALLWRGDFQNARQLLQAMARRIDRVPRRVARKSRPAPVGADAFHRHRLAQSQRSRTLAMVLLPFDAGYRIPLRRAPDVTQACIEAYGASSASGGHDGHAATPFVASLRELLGVIGAHEWRRNGIEIAALNDRIVPHYGVFSPVRGEYVHLVAEMPLPQRATTLAFDVGTGTGVLAAVLARRGVQRIVATDQDDRALACAHDNIVRLGLSAQVDIIRADLFPEGRAPLIVCNPPWISARPSSPIEHAIYDPENRMLLGFLGGLAAHLSPGGEGWLLLSDIAEHLGLRTRAMLLDAIDAAGLKVLSRCDTRPTHPKSQEQTDALHAARSMEVTSLWRLAPKTA